MILGLLVYGITVSLILTAAGFGMEPLAARIGWPRRVVWAGALLFSVGVPVVMVSTPHAPAVTAPDSIRSNTALRSQGGEYKPALPTTPSNLTPMILRPSSDYSSPTLDRVFGVGWLAISTGALAVWTLSWIGVRRQRKQWRCKTVDGIAVWVTPKLGPAVLGFMRPQILIPQWILEAPAALRSTVLLHEREHIDSYDPLLLLFGLLVAVAAPWNLPLWWQLRRLRFAVEADCDARVLRKGTPLATYGEVLLTVSQRRLLAPLGAMAIAKPRSQLERRIRLMALPDSRPTRWIMGAAATVGAMCVAFAIEVPAPALRDTDLRHLPLHDWSPYLPMAEAAARAADPTVFRGDFEGTVMIDVYLKRDGAVLDIQTHKFPTGPLENSNYVGYVAIDFLADMDRGYGTGGRKFVGWFGPKHSKALYVEYAVMKWAHDPARSASRVRDAVAKKYPEFFQSYPLSYPYKEQTGKLLTVFMNDDRTINRATLNQMPNPPGFSEGQIYDRIVALGIPPDQFGRFGRIFNTLDPSRLEHYPNAPHLDIIFAWPRHPDDPPDIGSQTQPAFNNTFDKRSQEIDRRAPDELFLKRYFPDIWEKGPSSASEQAWILVDLAGKVCDTGRVGTGGFSGITKELNKRYPGAQIGLDISVGAETANNGGVQLDYMRLQDDSPLTSCQSIESVRRAP